ncbi:hypothetical protein ADUPG1_010744 [Aduncisulcus paluster]|uniref:Uncharacterized protein n=1 Tax=Aduncisulcus paluster TaxID=2918883 RepID=A0ABQ5JTT3_9EUKA|nr:hypothetical protein ADUPG1_010744 [Aduncisulcus paluster]
MGLKISEEEMRKKIEYFLEHKLMSQYAYSINEVETTLKHVSFAVEFYRRQTAKETVPRRTATLTFYLVPEGDNVKFRFRIGHAAFIHSVDQLHGNLSHIDKIITEELRKLDGSKWEE